MTGRAAWLLALAALGCDASLGGDGTGQQDASTVADSRRADATPIDAAIDARACAGGAKAQTAPDGSCFVMFTTPVTYVNARAGCQSINAHLAYLKTAQLDAFATTFVGDVDTWIGGSDRVTEGSFLWDDNTALIYVGWGTDEPNNGGNVYQEDCVIIAGAKVNNGWDDRPCDATEIPESGNFAYLCQY